MKHIVEYTDLTSGTREIYGDIPRVFSSREDARRFAAMLASDMDAVAVPVGPALAGRIEAIIAAKH